MFLIFIASSVVGLAVKDVCMEPMHRKNMGDISKLTRICIELMGYVVATIVAGWVFITLFSIISLV